MSTYTTEALVLRTQALGEADRIVTFLSPERGKFRAVAKGARKPKSRLVGVSEPLTRSVVYCSTGRSLDIVTQAELQGVYGDIRRDLGRMAWASYVLELTDIAVGEAHVVPGLYESVVAFAETLDAGGNPEVLARSFELRALGQLGYEPVLNACASCSGEVPGPTVAFSPKAGGLLCDACAGGTVLRVSRGAIESMRVLGGSERRLASALRLPRSVAREVEDANIAFLSYHLDRVPRSLAFAREVGAMMAP